MNISLQRRSGIAALALVSSLVLASCAASTDAPTEDDVSTLAGSLTGSGSSAVGAAQEVWIAEFVAANPNVDIAYDPTGSGAGREAFLAGESDFAGTDRSFNDEEIAAGGFASCAPESGVVQLPLYVSPIAIIFNLDGIPNLDLDPATIAGIFTGAITTWDAPQIAALNEDVDLPSMPIVAVHREDDSGTTDNFTDYLASAAPEVWTFEPDGVWPLQNGLAAPQTAGVLDAVTADEGTIGYADASRAGDLGTVSVKVGDEFVDYTPEAAAAVVDASPLVEGRAAFDLSIELDRTPDSAAYPVVLVAYIVACETYLDSAVAPLVKAYLSYMASTQGQADVAEGAGSAPISAELQSKVQAAIAIIG